ncbi:MAG TPA: 30S ribosomal protein S2 [Gemmatales bacterium]|nr:30S ribosomal protein S2 [Gemmatales bacterium]
MALIEVKELVDAGVHYGHRSSRWNPKMRPYIYGKRNLIHIIDLRETLRGLLRAYKYVTKIVSQGKLVMFVGTKRQAKEIVVREAQRCGMPCVSERWLGGTLTNFRTIRSRLQRLTHLESLETTGQINTYSKKMISSITRERKKIDRNLSGIRDMNRIPEALIIIDPHKEHIAVKEARKMGVTVVALIDTDSDPDMVDLPIPGNDDSIRSIELILSKLAQAVIEGKAAIPPELLKQLEEKPREERGERGRGKGDRRGGGGGRGGDRGGRDGDRGGRGGRSDNRGGGRGGDRGRNAPADPSSDKPEVPAAPAAEPAGE